MNMKRLLLAIVAAYVAMSILGIATEVLLADFTIQMKAISRMGADLEAHAMWMYLGYFIVTILFCYIYAHHHEGKGWQEGARYGLLIGLMMSGISMVMYATMPFDGTEVFISALAGVVIYTVGGIVTALVYKNESS